MPEMMKGAQALVQQARESRLNQDRVDAQIAPAEEALPCTDCDELRAQVAAGVRAAPATEVSLKKMMTAALSPAPETSTALITVSGGGTGAHNPIFAFADEISPGSVHIPWGVRGAEKTTASLRAAIDAQLGEGKSVVVIGHSLGSAVAFNLINSEYADRPVTGIYVDPPYRAALSRIPLINSSPSLGAIKHAAQGGIADDPNTVDWTRGRPFLGLNFLTHDAFDFPYLGKNRERLEQLREKVRGAIAGAADL